MVFPRHDDIESQLEEKWQMYQKGDRYALDEIYQSLLPYCRGVVSKTCGKYIYEEDEEASVIPGAILEAIEKYDCQRGKFMIYLGQVVRNRTIDFMRREKKHLSIPFSSLDSDENIRAVDNEFFENIIDNLARKQEIEQLKRILNDFNIELEELVRMSPRQRRTRYTALKAASIIAKDEELSNYLLNKKLLPAKALQERWKIKAKILERYRKYIITASLIKIYGLSCLEPYVMPQEGGDERD